MKVSKHCKFTVAGDWSRGSNKQPKRGSPVDILLVGDHRDLSWDKGKTTPQRMSPSANNYEGANYNQNQITPRGRKDKGGKIMELNKNQGGKRQAVSPVQARTYALIMGGGRGGQRGGAPKRLDLKGHRP